MTRSNPASVLTSVDFPTFGRPPRRSAEGGVRSAPVASSSSSGGNPRHDRLEQFGDPVPCSAETGVDRVDGEAWNWIRLPFLPSRPPCSREQERFSPLAQHPRSPCRGAARRGSRPGRRPGRTRRPPADLPRIFEGVVVPLARHVPPCRGEGPAPSYSTGSATRSRVIPLVERDARRFRAIRLKRVDFPTFGRPQRHRELSPAHIQMPQQSIAPHQSRSTTTNSSRNTRDPSLFELEPRGRPDLLEERAALPDHDPFWIPFNEDRPGCGSVLLRLFLVFVDRTAML